MSFGWVPPLYGLAVSPGRILDRYAKSFPDDLEYRKPEKFYAVFRIELQTVAWLWNETLRCATVANAKNLNIANA